jgi:hypothetical protein
MGGPSDFQFGFQFVTNGLMHRFIWNVQTLFVRQPIPNLAITPKSIRFLESDLQCL